MQMLFAKGARRNAYRASWRRAWRAWHVLMGGGGGDGDGDGLVGVLGYRGISKQAWCMDVREDSECAWPCGTKGFEVSWAIALVSTPT